MNSPGKLFRTLAITFGLLSLTVLSTQTSKAQAIQYDSENDWVLTVTGQLPVFIVASEHQDFNSDGSDQFATRVMSGFNPANITFTVEAPEMNGLNVKGIFQINHHLQGPSIQNEGLFEGRVADIQISGNFGIINIGKGFGIFNSSSIADAGSGMGVGRFVGPDGANATLGRIGSGYTYANFNPRVTYTTPDLRGFSLKAGLINPEKPSGAPSQQIQTATPRLEAQANYNLDLNSGKIDLWLGGMVQDVEVVSADYNYDISGWDLGARLTAAGLRFTGAYSETQGVGADGLIGISLTGTGLDQAEVEASQWYGEATYALKDLTLGLSYGEGSQDAVTTVLGGSPDITNKLLMMFTRYKVTNNLTLLGEIQDFSSDSQNNYQAMIIGMQLNF
ncbi:porin [Gracilimonas sp. Q87]|uniref:porin n=1 Tax=Gracilimonas sp. Q87 TaxID=3384766 RepID=UPI0039841F09